MKWSLLAFCALCSFFSASVSAEETITDRSTGLVFPREVSFDANGKQYQLEATGVATRKKLIIKVYSIVSYLQKGASGGDKFDKILSNDNAKQITLKYVRDVTVSQIQGAFQDSFQRVFPGQQYAQMQGDISTFIQMFNQPLRKGDEDTIRWIPGGLVEVLANGKKVGSINNPAFAAGLWKIWFGQGSIVDRNDLVSQMK